MTTHTQLDFCSASINNFVEHALSLKVIKRSKCEKAREKLKLLNNNRINRKEPDPNVVLEALNSSMELQQRDIVLASAECLEKLIKHDYFKKSFKDACDVAPHLRSLLSSAYEYFCQDSDNEALELAIIRTFSAASKLDRQLIHILDLVSIMRLLINVSSWTKSEANRSVIYASLASIVIDLFQRLESGDMRNSDGESNKDIGASRTSSSYLDKPGHNTPPSLDFHSNGETDFKSPMEDNFTEIPFGSPKLDHLLEADPNDPIARDEILQKKFSEFYIDWSNQILVDALVIYEYLCSRSIVREVENFGLDFASAQTALKLISAALNISGNVFRSNECFIELTRKLLFPALLQPLILKKHRIFKTSLKIFIIILDKFRASFRYQIQVFFDEILLKALEAGQTQTQETAMFVLSDLIQICSDPKFVSCLYVNYDCDMDSKNIFGRIVDAFCSIAKDPNNFVKTPPAGPNQMTQNLLKMARESCLSCLTKILNHIKETAEGILIKTAASSNDEIDAAVSAREGLMSRGISIVKERKDILEEGMKLFSLKPQRGITYLIEHGIIQDDFNSVATFLHQEERLDPVKIGHFLGDHDKTCIEIMHKYVEQIDIKGLEFLPALRLFLSNFQLPGEAQKIDRLIEKFASHYYEQNSNSEYFDNADGAYLLAYSIIMLTTDLHNPRVKRKITPEQYIAMNRGSDSTANLSDEYLLEIYQSVLKQEITLKANYPGCGNRAVDYASNSEISNDLSKMARIALSNSKMFLHSRDSFVEESIESFDTTRSMFETIWKQMLVCFGWVFSVTEDLETIYCCLDGIRSCVRIASIYDLSLIRNSFISSLLQFSMFNKGALVVSDIKPKNIAVSRTILQIAREDGNLLSNSWLDILVCISNIGQLQSSCTDSTSLIMSNNNFDAKIISMKQSSTNSRDNNINYSMKLLKQISSQDLVVSLDHVFTNSTTFDAEGIMSFVSCLCEVSKVELFDTRPPRTFTLQKILEVAFYNMNRSRILWSKIWSILGPFLIQVSSLENENISIFCIDSIRQLSSKFLERKEFNNFHFQSEFFKPFHHIMIHNKFPNVKELGLRCVHQIVQSYAQNISSGWSTVFDILSHACVDPTQNIEEIAFDSLNIVIEVHFLSIIKWFDQALCTIIAFSSNAYSRDLNVRAIHLLEKCFEMFKLATSGSEPPIEDKSTLTIVEIDSFIWTHGWRKIFLALIKVIQEPKSHINHHALIVFFDLINRNRSFFSPDIWQEIFSFIRDIFDVLTNEDVEKPVINKYLWLSRNASQIMDLTLDVYINNFDKLPYVVTFDIFSHIRYFLSIRFGGLSIIVVKFFVRMIRSLYSKFDDKMWTLAVEFIHDVCSVSILNFICDIDTELPQSPDIDLTLGLESLVSKGPEFDYSTRDGDEVRRSSGAFTSDEEEEITSNSHVSSIYAGFAHCHADVELLRGIDGFIDSPEAQPIFSLLSDDQLIKVIHTLLEHFHDLDSFNNDAHLIVKTSLKIEHLSPCLKQKWRGVVYPSMLVQQFHTSICIIKLVSLMSLRSSCNIDLSIFIKEMQCLLKRYHVALIQTTEPGLAHIFLSTFLEFIVTCQEELFVKCIKLLYREICLLIKVKHSRISTYENLTNVFLRLNKFISDLPQT